MVEDDLTKWSLDRGIAKDRDRWRAQIYGKRPTCASTDKGRKRRIFK